jgi:hypothetical protein
MSNDYTELRRIARKHEMFAWPVSLTDADADELGDVFEELDSLRAEIERLRNREATLFEAVKRCERDAQRALREAQDGSGPGVHRCAFRVACEAIQQRAAGIEALPQEGA